MKMFTNKNNFLDLLAEFLTLSEQFEVTTLRSQLHKIPQLHNQRKGVMKYMKSISCNVGRRD